MDTPQIINVYIDESCHVGSNDGKMLLGALWLDANQLFALSDTVRLIKKKHNIASRREIKWTKVSNSKLDYYKELINLFLSLDQVNYRAVIIDREVIDYKTYNKTPDGFYYTMQYLLVRNIAEKRLGTIRLFLDYKDTWSSFRSKELADYLNNTRNLHHKALSAQPVRSHEVVGLQIADLITGAVMYANKPQEQQLSQAKREIIQLLEESLGQKLTEGTAYNVEKFNLFFWEPKIQ
jgi:hypothetical protein